MQIKFDKEWEGKVVKMILHNLSNLFGKSLQESLNDLSNADRTARRCWLGRRENSGLI